MESLVGKWDTRFLELARVVGSWSKDKTKVGCVIIAPDLRIVGCGFNGFPRGCDDSPELYADREIKLRRVVHAERNALLFACRSVDGCTVYTSSLPPCAQCAAMLIQAGITRVVSPKPSREIAERWREDLAEAARMYGESGVRLDIVEGE
jgi:dCMP deaminase